jgi:hypothetical protein
MWVTYAVCCRSSGLPSAPCPLTVSKTWVHTESISSQMNVIVGPLSMLFAVMMLITASVLVYCSATMYVESTCKWEVRWNPVARAFASRRQPRLLPMYEYRTRKFPVSCPRTLKAT